MLASQGWCNCPDKDKGASGGHSLTVVGIVEIDGFKLFLDRHPAGPAFAYMLVQSFLDHDGDLNISV